MNEFTLQARGRRYFTSSLLIHGNTVVLYLREKLTHSTQFESKRQLTPVNSHQQITDVKAEDVCYFRTTSCYGICKQKPRDEQRCLSGGFAAAGRMTAELEEVVGSSCASM